MRRLLATGRETAHIDLSLADLAAGEVLDLQAHASIEELGEALWQEIIEVASGRLTRSEQLDFGEEEFNPWQLGSVL